MSRAGGPIATAPDPREEMNSPRRRVRPVLLDILAVTFVGALFRLGPVVASGSPISDGGMFEVMIREIRNAGMSLPAMTSYTAGP